MQSTKTGTTAMKRTLIVFAILAVAGCSTAPEKIEPTYVSPSNYTALSCQQIDNEIESVNGQASALYTGLRKDRNKDNTVTAIGLVLFWPALFFIDGDSPDARKYARLLGESEALVIARRGKGC